MDVFESGYGKLFENRRVSSREKKNPKGNTLYTDKTPNEDPQKCDPTKTENSHT